MRTEEQSTLRRVAIRRARMSQRIEVGPIVGRGPLIARFHDLRRVDRPAVLVVVGMQGSGKSQLLAYLRAVFRRRQTWRWGEEVDASLDLTRIGREREVGLAALSSQLRSASTIWRRVRTPRFQMMRRRLSGFRRRVGPFPFNEERIARELAFAMKVGGGVVLSPHTGAERLAQPTLAGRVVRVLASLWAGHGFSPASRWVRKHLSGLPKTPVSGEQDRRFEHALMRALSRALAQDLAVATRRKRFGVRTILVFVESYDWADSEVRARPWLVEFADDLRQAGARVMLVVACRDAGPWSEWLDEEEGDSVERIDGIELGERVEIHRLEAIEPRDCCQTLFLRYGIPAEEVPYLATVSRGHALLLNVLGKRFSGGTPMTDEEERLMKRLPVDIEHDEGWVARVCTAVVPEILDGLDPALRRHLAAAATLRTFDRRLLAHVMGPEFDGAQFKHLVDLAALVEAPRPSRMLATDQAHRVRDFVREFLRRDEDQAEARDRWHCAAAEYLGELEREAGNPDRRFALRSEWLLHRLFCDFEHGQRQFLATFEAELKARRHESCELLLDVADELGYPEREWRARVDAFAGRLYLHTRAYELAHERLQAAARLAGEPPEIPDVLVRVAPALARCYLLMQRLDEAIGQADLVLERFQADPIARFQATWVGTLAAKNRGSLKVAKAKAQEGVAHLDALLREDPDAPERAEREFGVADLQRKPAHLMRHLARIACDAGLYAEAARAIEDARRRYHAFPERRAELALQVVESQLLRLEGEDTVSYAAAVWDALGRVGFDEHAEVQGLRCLGQALLARSDPSAEEQFARLTDFDARKTPGSVALGWFGRGELHRLAGRHADARTCYVRAVSCTDLAHVTERLYGRLGLAALALDTGDPVEARGQLDELRGRTALEEYPLLAFWMHLLEGWANVGRAVPLSRRRPAEDSLREAERISATLVTRTKDPGPQQSVLDAVRVALATGGRIAPFRLVLP